MANKKQLDYTKVRGCSLTFTNNPYGDKIHNMLHFPLYVTTNENGQYVAYYYDRDMLDGDLDYSKRQKRNFEYVITQNILLVDVLPEWLERQGMRFESFVKWMCQTTETEYDMSGRHSAEAKAKRKAAKENGEVNEWGEPLRYDCPRVYSVNELRVNGHF